MHEANIQCERCDVIYTIFRPDFANGIPEPNAKVSSEVGCPACLHPDGVFLFFSTPGEPARYIGSTLNGEQFAV